MVNASFNNRLSHAVDVLENRSQQNRPLQVRRGLEEDPDAALDRHFAAHPEDRGANIVIFEFYEDEGRAGDGWDFGPPAGRGASNLEDREPRRF